MKKMINNDIPVVFSCNATFDKNKLHRGKIMKRLFCIMALIIFFVYPIEAHAHSNAQKIEIDTYHFTDHAYYIDLLIRMDSDDEFYTDLNNDNIERFDFDTTNLVEYRDIEGYISFSCHYKDIYSNPVINKRMIRDTLISENCFTLDKDLTIDLNVMKALYDKKREFKIAILDKDGNIIQVSDSFEVHNNDKDKGYIASDVKYDISNNKLEYYWSNNYPTDSGIKINNMPLFTGIVLFLIISMIFLIFRRSKKVQ